MLKKILLLVLNCRKKKKKKFDPIPDPWWQNSEYY